MSPVASKPLVTRWSARIRRTFRCPTSRSLTLSAGPTGWYCTRSPSSGDPKALVSRRRSSSNPCAGKPGGSSTSPPPAFTATLASPLLVNLGRLDADAIYLLFGSKEFLPSVEEWAHLAGGLCAYQPNQCANLLAAIAGYNPDNVDEVCRGVAARRGCFSWCWALRAATGRARRGESAHAQTQRAHRPPP